MRALQLFGDRDLRLTEIDAPPPPAAGEVQIRVRAMALNFLDLWGFRGMAFAKRAFPVVVGVEAAGEVLSAGDATDYGQLEPVPSAFYDDLDDPRVARQAA